MTSPRSKREAPPRYLKNYLASIKRYQDLPSTLADSTFRNFISEGSSSSVTPSSLSNVNIGFTLNVNNVSYVNAHISEYGYVILQDPSGFADTDVVTSIDDNKTIKSTFSNNRNHVLLCPWFDSFYVPSNSVEALSTTAPYNATLNTAQELLDIKQGIDTRNWPFSPIDRGARYQNIFDSRNGKGFIVRWTLYYGDGNVSSLTLGPIKFKFELSLFENGKIEFRYWPLERYRGGDTTLYGIRNATCGIFWSSTKFGSDQFRDFAPFLNSGSLGRTLNELGGASYDPSYTENTLTYSNGIRPAFWPGPGMITFEQPKNLGKFLPRKMSQLISSTKQLAPRSGLFDDRKTFNFRTGSVAIEMPSTFPSRITGNSSPEVNMGLRQLLFTSVDPTGSIKINGSVKRNIIDSQLEMLDALDDYTKSVRDLSFNEVNQNYLVTQTTSSFYTNENSLSLFGDGFTSPIKSKTKFNVSFPVTKTTKMSVLSSSFYWYNKQRQAWDSYGHNLIREIPPTWIDYDAADFNNSYYNGESNTKREHKIVETSIGFDAVGRKIVSGNLYVSASYVDPGGDPTTVNPNRQSTAGIGTVVNYLNINQQTPIPNRYIGSSGLGSSLIQNVLQPFVSGGVVVPPNSNKFPFVKSITDSSNFYPDKSCQFSLGNEYPFLIERVVASIPIKASGSWFNDITTCNKAFSTDDIDPADNTNSYPNYIKGYPIGPIDFGGPGITLAIHSPKKSGNNKTYLDLIASGTITHNFDNKKEVIFKKDPSMKYYSLRPSGFLSFSNPTAIISGTYDGTTYTFTGDVKLEMTPSVAGGVTLVRNTRPHSGSLTTILSTISGSTLRSFGESYYGDQSNGWVTRQFLSVYVQQISPLSRGASSFEFNGSSILGGNIAYFNAEEFVSNPLYGVPNPDIDAVLSDSMVSTDGQIDSLALYSLVDSRESPYLIMPGENISVSISKTRPTIYKMSYYKPDYSYDGGQGGIQDEQFFYGNYVLTGSHDGVLLNTGSINLTFYGSYVKEGSEYHL